MLIQAGASEAGREFAARHAELIFTTSGTLGGAVDFYDNVKDRASGYGRRPDEIHILPGCSPVVGRTDAEAEAKYQEICDLVSIEDALNYLGRYFNDIDFTQFELDEQFPELGDFARNGWESSTDRLKQMARDEQLNAAADGQPGHQSQEPIHGDAGKGRRHHAGMVRVGSR